MSCPLTRPSKGVREAACARSSRSTFLKTLVRLFTRGHNIQTACPRGSTRCNSTCVQVHLVDHKYCQWHPKSNLRVTSNLDAPENKIGELRDLDLWSWLQSKLTKKKIILHLLLTQQNKSKKTCCKCTKLKYIQTQSWIYKSRLQNNMRKCYEHQILR